MDHPLDIKVPRTQLAGFGLMEGDQNQLCLMDDNQGHILHLRHIDPKETEVNIAQVIRDAYDLGIKHGHRKTARALKNILLID